MIRSFINLTFLLIVLVYEVISFVTAEHFCAVLAYVNTQKINKIKTITSDEEKKHHYDPITDWVPPDKALIQAVIEKRVKPLQRLVSPIFFSTDINGKRHKGLSRLPKTNERPLLIVGNHQLCGFDMWLVVPQLFIERNIFVRGLGHPVIFEDDEQNRHIGGSGGPALVDGVGGSAFSLFRTFGAVAATPRNLYRLMETNQVLLHYPGGAREAYHGKGEAYKLFWPDKIDFVRTAAKFNATIVTLSAVGAADSGQIILDSSSQLMKIPGLRNIFASNPFTVKKNTRFNVINNHNGKTKTSSREDDDTISPPLVLPKMLPERHYFLFGKPTRTDNVDHKDRKACNKLYFDIQEELKSNLNDLLSAREKDPFKDSAIRMAYEYIIGRPAASFSINEIV